MKRAELSEAEGALLDAYELIIEDEPYGLQDVLSSSRCWTPAEREKLAHLMWVGRWLKNKIDA